MDRVEWANWDEKTRGNCGAKNATICEVLWWHTPVSQTMAPELCQEYPLQRSPRPDQQCQRLQLGPFWSRWLRTLVGIESLNSWCNITCIFYIVWFKITFLGYILKTQHTSLFIFKSVFVKLKMLKCKGNSIPMEWSGMHWFQENRSVKRWIGQGLLLALGFRPEYHDICLHGVTVRGLGFFPLTLLHNTLTSLLGVHTMKRMLTFMSLWR